MSQKVCQVWMKQTVVNLLHLNFRNARKLHSLTVSTMGKVGVTIKMALFKYYKGFCDIIDNIKDKILLKAYDLDL